MKGLFLRTSFFCFISTLATGQSPAIYYNVQGHYGRIIRHTPKLLFDIPGSSWGLDVNVQFQGDGAKEWQVAQRFPKVGISTLYYDLGDPEILGRAYGIAPNLTLSLLDRNDWQLEFLLGTGLAFIDRWYHVNENPANNAIGSPVNNLTLFKLTLGRTFGQHWHVQVGGSLVHFSNGASQLPNLGLNIPALIVGLRYSPAPLYRGAVKDLTYEKTPAHRWGGNAHLGMAFKELSVPGGPKQPVYAAAIAVEYRLSKYNHLLFGVDYEYHKDVFQFTRHNFTFHTDAEARRGATRWGISLSDEIHFGRVALLLQAGWYVSRRHVLALRPMYNKLSLRYFLPGIGSRLHRPYASVTLKSHAITAEYIALGFGMKI